MGLYGKRRIKNAVSPSKNITSSGKHACCMSPDTPMRSVKYLRNTPKSTPRSGHIKITKPALAANQSVVSLSGSTAASRRTTSWSMVILFPIKSRENWLKSAIVKAHRQTQKTVIILMVLTILKLMKLNMIMMNPNDSMRNIR